MIYDTLFSVFVQEAGRVEKWKEPNGWKFDLTVKKE
jgi:hypothetical protein